MRIPALDYALTVEVNAIHVIAKMSAQVVYKVRSNID